jgi:hypothetical protein
VRKVDELDHAEPPLPALHVRDEALRAAEELGEIGLLEALGGAGVDQKPAQRDLSGGASSLRHWSRVMGGKARIENPDLR